MSELTYEDASVDLTEDEDSCEEYASGATAGFHFVDCSSKIVPSPGISPIKKPVANVAAPPPLTPIRKFVTQQPSHKPTIRLKPLPKMIKKPETSTPKVGNLNEVGGKSLLQMDRSYEQIKPSVSKVAESPSPPRSTQNNIEIVCLDSDGESSSKDTAEPVNSVPTTPSVVTPPRPPGKMLIIKKNNKYYKIIIPHNVIPDINQSTGPVLINIPEVGPLVITSDHKGANPLHAQNAQLSLNLDEISEGLSRTVATTKDVAPPEPEKPAPDPEKSEMRAQLYNNKFCWWYTKGRKRDLYGFTYYDRFGFSKAECMRARKCARNLELIVAKKRGELVKQLCKYEKFKERDYVKVKIVEIDDIVTKKRGRKRKSNPAAVAAPDPLETNKRRRAPKEPEYEEYDSDLLLTKKVVILDGKNKETNDIYRNATPGPSQPKRLRKTPFLKQMDLVRAKKSTKRQNFTPKPCYVQMTRDERVEKAYRKYCQDMEHKRGPKVNPNTKRRSKNMELLAKNEVNATKLNTKTFYENMVKIFCTRIIDSEARFKKELNQLKPLLLVNEHNLSTLNYSAEFSKSNILYVVKEKHFPDNILRNEGFISGVELGYIKLVDSQLFCKYVMDPISFKQPQTDSYTSEHNYCFVKKK